MISVNQLWPTPGSENALDCWRISVRHHAAKHPCLNFGWGFDPGLFSRGYEI